MPLLIALSGRAESGKSTVADYLERQYGYKIVALGNIIREQFTGWRPSRKKGVTPPNVMHVWEDIQRRPNLLYSKPTDSDLRMALQYFSDEMVLADRRHWIKALAKEIKIDDPVRVVLSSIRLPQEFDFVRANRGHVWRVIRSGHKTEGAWKKHPTETSLDGAPFNAYVANNSKIEDLYQTVDALVRGFYL